nr:restriction endonuclease subunit S [Vibrio crassostreae]
MSEFLTRHIEPVQLEDNKAYIEIGIRSWGKGIFSKEPTTKADIGNKRVFWLDKDLFVVNIVFAWEQAVAVTTSNEVGKIASHRFPMFRVDTKKAVLKYVMYKFLTGRGKQLLELASPGGAGRNKTLGQKEFDKLKISLPSPKEQQKITDLLVSVDKKIKQLTEKLCLLKEYKAGVMQRTYNQEIRFKDKDGNEFPCWDDRAIGDIMKESRIKGNTGDLAKKLTVKVWGKGVVPKKTGTQGSENTQYYKRKAGQFIYGKLDFLNCAFAIIPDSLDGYESTLDLPSLDVCCSVNKFFVLETIKQRWFYKRYGDIANGSRKAKRINVDVFRAMPIRLPHKDEQDKIMQFWNSIDAKVEAVEEQIEQTQQFKKGLLQQMFV